MMKKSIGVLLVVLYTGILISLQSKSVAQDSPTTTPFSPILIQGNPNVGQVQPFAMSDIAIRTGIRAWQDTGWTGTGIKVGVLDRGFGQILSFEESVGITVNVGLSDDKNTYNLNTVNHGTLVLETINTIAPQAELFACEYDTFDKYTLCIDWMIISGVNIINHSAGVPALPLDGSSRWSRQVDRAAQANILWVNSAGNFAQGFYTDVFTDNNLNSLHEFRGNAGIVEALGVAPIVSSSTGVAMLSWLNNGEIPANEINIDLQILDAQSGEVIAGSYNSQTGFPGEQALEYLSFDMNHPFAVQVIDQDGTASGVRFALFVEFARLPSGETQQSIIAPGDSPNSLTIGALQGMNIAPYSSRGPLATGAIKPDLAAPGEIQLFDGSQFVGTSAAAPVVAGSAALVWQANPDFEANDVRRFILNSTQDDDQILGNDINFGNGRLYLSVPSSDNITATPTIDAVVPQQPTVLQTNTIEPTQILTPTTPPTTEVRNELTANNGSTSPDFNIDNVTLDRNANGIITISTDVEVERSALAIQSSFYLLPSLNTSNGRIQANNGSNLNVGRTTNVSFDLACSPSTTVTSLQLDIMYATNVYYTNTYSLNITCQ